MLVLSQYLESHYASLLLQDAPEHMGCLLKDRVTEMEYWSTHYAASALANASSTRPSSVGYFVAHGRHMTLIGSPPVSATYCR